MKKVKQRPLCSTPSTNVTPKKLYQGFCKEGELGHLNQLASPTPHFPFTRRADEANLDGTSHTRLIKVIKLLAVR